MMKVGIIGAGPAGLACGVMLAAKGIAVDIYEGASAVGGMTKSFELWGQRVDLGPHRFFSKDQRVNRLWSYFTGKDYVMVDRLTRIYYDKKFFLYPVKAVNALSNLGVLTATECVFSYLHALTKPKGQEKSFEEWVANKFGYKLYSIFFKTYSERLWGIPCTELDADFARQRIKGLNMSEVIRDALFGGGAKRHKTLLDRFAYPRNGAGEPYENMATFIREHGGTIHLSTRIKGIYTEDKKATGIELENGTIEKADYVVSTASFTDMLKSIPELGDDVHKIASELTYRNTTLVYLCIKDNDLFRDNWLYIHEPSVQMGRITNFSNWSPYMRNGSKDTILALEYWSYDEDALWHMNDEELIELARKDLMRTGLVQKDTIGEGHVVRLHRSYPVYGLGYSEKLSMLQKAADQLENICFVGRNGSFKYNNQDHSLLMGMMAAKNILAGRKLYDLWTVNTDDEYQEKARQTMNKK
ncbi:MAG: FAD-dependent oxidoreductase [Lachnospiraceae bacterium]|nr:FAD-dependent oxidoreductase [Lachnospiraceae bacterium]